MKREERTDFIGPYVAYVYDDGHVETDPPGRPISREDAQRLRRIELLSARPTDELAASTAARSVPPGILDQSRATGALTVTLKAFYATQQAMATIATSGRAEAADMRTLCQTVELGD